MILLYCISVGWLFLPTTSRGEQISQWPVTGRKDQDRYWKEKLRPKIVIFSLIYQFKHVFWVLKRTVSMRRFFWVLGWEIRKIIFSLGAWVLTFINELVSKVCMCTQQKIRSVCASAQSDQDLHCPYEESLGSWVPIEHPSKTDQTAQITGQVVPFAVSWLKFYMLILPAIQSILYRSRIRESLPQFENRLMARMNVRRITGSTMYQKAPFC